MGDQVAVRRLSLRRWRVLSHLAQLGSASTLDVALVCAVSPLTAHRDLVWLHEAGLVRRDRSAEDRTHTWWYGVTVEGTEVLRGALTASGRPVPLRLGQRPPARRMPCSSCRWSRCRGATRGGASCSSGWRRWRPRRGCASTT
ncbi:DeoR family transcriptional regulator [Micromonospora sp. MH33]|uniref:DeoR family transcriptional regulator n=1 Tax=Micromonospora sp. MH33 TaxID=1945509 RepID=UPI001FEF06AD|nr:DeoR family transcriptional regulator [Micromonospora sp. MH33]